MKLSSADTKEIRRLSSSPSFLRLADSILVNLDRDTVSELLAGYLYFKSKGRPDLDFAFYVAIKKFRKAVTISVSIAAALLPGLLFDRDFRRVIFGAARKSFGRNRNESKSASFRDEWDQ